MRGKHFTLIVSSDIANHKDFDFMLDFKPGTFILI